MYNIIIHGSIFRALFSGCQPSKQCIPASAGGPRTRHTEERQKRGIDRGHQTEGLLAAEFRRLKGSPTDGPFTQTSSCRPMLSTVPGMRCTLTCAPQGKGARRSHLEPTYAPAAAHRSCMRRCRSCKRSTAQAKTPGGYPPHQKKPSHTNQLRQRPPSQIPSPPSIFKRSAVSASHERTCARPMPRSGPQKRTRQCATSVLSRCITSGSAASTAACSLRALTRPRPPAAAASAAAVPRAAARGRPSGCCRRTGGPTGWPPPWSRCNPAGGALCGGGRGAGQISDQSAISICVLSQGVNAKHCSWSKPSVKTLQPAKAGKTSGQGRQKSGWSKPVKPRGQTLRRRRTCLV